MNGELHGVLDSALEENASRARSCLQRFALGTQGHFIGGSPRDGLSGETFANHSPAAGSFLNHVAAGNEADVDAACNAARDAFPGWAALSGERRAALLHGIADAIEARSEEIALVESMDTGQALRFTAKAALRGARNFRFFADLAPEARKGPSLPASEHANYVSRQPIGPVGVITPWNTPFMLSTWKIAPALAAGCTVVHKPVEWSPLTAQLLVEICAQAGLPSGVLNTVQGIGEQAGRALTEHEAIRAIAFVGESATGARIMAQSAPTLKRVHFELGGKNPVIVFEDADLKRALDAVVFMIYSLNGERCTSSSRLLVQESIHDRFVARVAQRANNIRVGHPLGPNTEVGPLIHPAHLEKVTSYFGVAREEGATIAAGGSRAELPWPGHYVKPTLFTGARNGMRIAQEEIFGPVLTAIPFRDGADALAQANDSRYGLAAYLWTGDAERAQRLSEALEVGMIWVNSQNVRHLPTPFGGMKASGIGRDGGDYSFDFYMETKNVSVAKGEHRIPRLGVG